MQINVFGRKLILRLPPGTYQLRNDYHILSLPSPAILTLVSYTRILEEEKFLPRQPPLRSISRSTTYDHFSYLQETFSRDLFFCSEPVIDIFWKIITTYSGNFKNAHCKGKKSDERV